jgi:hypothetical protein
LRRDFRECIEERIKILETGLLRRGGWGIVGPFLGFWILFIHLKHRTGSEIWRNSETKYLISGGSVVEGQGR